jgi:hypothetical protein
MILISTVLYGVGELPNTVPDCHSALKTFSSMVKRIICLSKILSPDILHTFILPEKR